MSWTAWPHHLLLCHGRTAPSPKAIETGSFTLSLASSRSMRQGFTYDNNYRRWSAATLGGRKCHGVTTLSSVLCRLVLLHTDLHWLGLSPVGLDVFFVLSLILQITGKKYEKLNG
ncbi:hypothetical protein TorRG33x02_037690 [Trema orientale]|uniref:Uncharacterized protein n=1 Tax=Trema orientale TaxID=63057 RepID=A0A2P5FRD2_TREOI|nr:hypothetical protein TorRG33x02_037690 [Trema orientale]